MELIIDHGLDLEDCGDFIRIDHRFVRKSHICTVNFLHVVKNVVFVQATLASGGDFIFRAELYYRFMAAMGLKPPRVEVLLQNMSPYDPAITREQAIELLGPAP